MIITAKNITSFITHPKMLFIETTIGATLIHYLNEVALLTLKYAIPTLIVIFADLYWGIAASKKRKEKVTVSSAVRRTFNKIVGYFCWILFSCSAGITYNLTTLPAMMMLLVFVLEGSSCANNILDKFDKQISIKKLLKMIGKKHNYDGLEEVIEEKPNNK